MGLHARRVRPSPYPAILCDAFDALAPAVQRAHLPPLTAVGTLDVVHGPHWRTPILARLMNLPRAGANQPVRVDVTLRDDTLVWSRQIGASVLRTRQWAEGATLCEQHGVGCIGFSLRADNGTLRYEQTSMRIAGLRVPRAVSPVVRATVAADAPGWRVDVHITWRRHLICHYGGVVRPV